MSMFVPEKYGFEKMFEVGCSALYYRKQDFTVLTSWVFIEKCSGCFDSMDKSHFFNKEKDALDYIEEVKMFMKSCLITPITCDDE